MMASGVTVSQVHDPAEVQEVNRLTSAWMTEEAPEWSSGVNDVALFMLLDPDGCFVGRLDGEIVTTLTVINYDEKYSFVGFFRTKPSHRGRGIGSEVWKAGAAHYGHRSVGMYASLKMVPKYALHGFKPHCEVGYYKIGHLSRFEDTDPAHITELTTFSLEDFLKFDQKYAPAPREKFMKAWISQPGCIALGYTVNGKLLGYGVVRGSFLKEAGRLGPLYAVDVSIAVKLAQALLVRARLRGMERVLYVDYSANPSTRSFAEGVGAERQGNDVAMYRGTVPEIDAAGIYAVTSGSLD